jgi:predicted nucleotidyltransferase component of viral defense system
MLTQEQAQKFSIDHQTVIDNVLKEHFQMIVLDQLFKSSFEDRLVFKGGTALRLAYSSVRFSEDLDFSLIGDVDYSDFESVLKKIIKVIPGLEIRDIYDKRFTLYAKLNFHLEYRPFPIGIKVEINKDVRDFDQKPSLIKSPFNNLEVIGRVYTLESIFKDKIRIMENQERREPRDLFDAWYISQKLGKVFEIKDTYKFSEKELMDSLFHFLPQNQRKVIKLFRT